MTVDLTTSVGSVALANPLMTAAGTAGTGDELAAYLDASRLGAMVVKSVSAEPWAGNPAPRAHATDAGMINAVGLQNPGVEAWLADDLPGLLDRGVTVVASIWGFTVDDYATAAGALAGVDGIVAVEVNVSCPNIEDRRRMFAHHPDAAREVIEATAASGLPRWAKLSPNVTDLGPIVDAVVAGGAEAVTLINTVMGMVIDTERRRPVLGAGGGGLSGPAIRPVAVRAIHDTVAEHPDLPVVGVGGVAKAEHAVELLMAGARAVQVGTATFADPDAPTTVLDDLVSWCERHGVRSIHEVIGAVHRPVHDDREEA
ncbi:MAG: dihydroorotate dehydrogenase [Actinomycetota bacterium]